jgi:hypothetical protein
MVSAFSPWSIMLAIGLSYIAFIMLRYIPSILSLLRVLSWSGVESYERLYLDLLRWSSGFSFFFY